MVPSSGLRAARRQAAGGVEGGRWAATGMHTSVEPELQFRRTRPVRGVGNLKPIERYTDTHE